MAAAPRQADPAGRWRAAFIPSRGRRRVALLPPPPGGSFERSCIRDLRGALLHEHGATSVMRGLGDARPDYGATSTTAVPCATRGTTAVSTGPGGSTTSTTAVVRSDRLLSPAAAGGVSRPDPVASPLQAAARGLWQSDLAASSPSGGGPQV
ncbi:hypothetical protein PR202_gb14192 [Eleusine coracana subsp. coracana]|uniref:Uncharacterized protein n=1 Tax=Eleusine coracana subsp. coracana TaxID=191504 RepID=A0AAV5EUJ4_ELECO|nr:hypothetical protein PR202_gb14192 [Eleusine coracana subsp. coracana]